MAYQALYRKYRPCCFEDVIGQDVVVNTLKNALKTGRTSHAYMFSGPRGIGKTTIAKILAKSLNCTNLTENGDSCGKCDNCLSILSGECTDIIEIDAASNNGVDEIREIRNKVNLVPSQLKYKVYIIDEVHMLSIGAFNALLKTLEEPPAHVVFILATTDPQKVPITIISRCQCFSFKRISDDCIVYRLKNVCSDEKIDIDEDVLKKIAHLSDGGMRDALGLLDKVSSFSNGKISIDEFNEINNLVGDDYKNKFIESVISKDIIGILNQIDYLYSSGKDIVVFCQELLDLLRDMMVNFYIKNECEYDIKFIVNFIELLNKLLVNLKNSSNLKIMFETSILSFVGTGVQNVEKCNSENIVNIISDKMKDNVGTTTVDSIIKKDVIIENIDEEFYNKFKFDVINNTFATARKDILINLKDNWSKLNDYVFDNKFGAVACYLIDTSLCAAGDNDIIIAHNYDSSITNGLKFLDKISELIEKILGKKYNFALITKIEWENAKKRYVNDKSNNVVYNYKQVNFDNLLKNNGKSEVVNDIIKEDDIVSKAIELFGEDVVKIQD